MERLNKQAVKNKMQCTRNFVLPWTFQFLVNSKCQNKCRSISRKPHWECRTMNIEIKLSWVSLHAHLHQNGKLHRLVHFFFFQHIGETGFCLVLGRQWVIWITSICYSSALCCGFSFPSYNLLKVTLKEVCFWKLVFKKLILLFWFFVLFSKFWCGLGDKTQEEVKMETNEC